VSLGELKAPYYAWRVAYARDELAVAYDSQATELLDRLYASRRLPANALAFVSSPPADPPDDVPGSRLTRHERAFIRSLYWLIKRRRPRRSIRLTWGELTPGGRILRVTIYSYVSGRRHVADHPGRAFTERPELRSTAAAG
jgi:hypothetical protein